MSLRPRYVFDKPLSAIILVACLAMIAGIWLAMLQRTSFEREQATAAAMKSNSNLAIAFQEQVSRTLMAAEQIASFVRAQYLHEGAGIDLQAWVREGMVRENAFTIISVVNEAGDIVASTQPTSAVNYADRDFFQAQRDNPHDTLYISQAVHGRVSGQWRVPLSLRITRADGRFGGVVVLAVAPAYFTDFYHQADLGRHGLLEVTGLDGIVRGRKVGSQNSFGLDAHDLPWFLRQADAQSGQFVDDGELDGNVRLISFRVLPDYPLMVTVGTSYVDELAPVAQRENAYLLASGGASAALLLFAGLMILGLARQRSVAGALQASEALYRATFDQAAMGIAHIAPDGRILRANEKFCDMLGQHAEALLGRTIYELSDPAWRERARQFVALHLSAAETSPSREIEKPYRRKDGSTLWVCETLGLVRETRDRHAFLVIVSQDITARKDLEARLMHEALHDALTGLSNRVLFQDRCERALESARRHAGKVAIIYLDLDHFKQVNDSHGHAVGDTLLQQVAQRLERCVRADSDDTVSRFGGDEFGLILPALNSPRDVEAIARKILEAIATPFDLDGIEARISASIGLALFPDHGGGPAELLQQADTAMYTAKQSGRNRFCWATARAQAPSGPGRVPAGWRAGPAPHPGRRAGMRS